MSDLPIEFLAARVESMMPRIARRIFTLQVNNISIELPSAQMRVCSFLLGFGESSISEVAEELGVSASAATQIADRLEKTGLVERISGATDRRVKLLRLTDRGVQMMEERRARRIERTTAALRVMSPVERRDLIESLNKLLDASLTLAAPDNSIDDSDQAREETTNTK